MKSFQLSRRIARRLQREFTRFRRHQMMKSVNGIIHVGANAGQERDEYAYYDLNVVWIEPNPWVFKELKAATSTYPKQRALEYLVLDKDGEPTILHISNNNGLSSSIKDLALHKEVWPSVHYTKDIELQSRTLDTIIEAERIDLWAYNGLVLDTQGSEILVLKGAHRVLQNMRMVTVEVADFESYAGCARPEQIASLLLGYGLREWLRIPLAKHDGGGHYYDIVYLRS